MIMSWVHITIGVLVIVSPWVFGTGNMAIVWTNSALGIVLVLMGIWKIMTHKTEQ